MLENRSFDHMLGFLDHGGLEPVSAHLLPNLDNPADPGSPTHVPFALAGYDVLSFDPKHGYPDVMRQLSANAGPWQAPYALTNTGFAWNYHERRGAPGEEVLGCYTPELVPILYTLAREYAVCSRWHCSLPSETWPNRLFAHAATSDNLVTNVERRYTNRTIFEALSSAGHHWQIYAGDIPQVAAFSELYFHDRGLAFQPPAGVLLASAAREAPRLFLHRAQALRERLFEPAPTRKDPPRRGADSRRLPSARLEPEDLEHEPPNHRLRRARRVLRSRTSAGGEAALSRRDRSAIRFSLRPPRAADSRCPRLSLHRSRGGVRRDARSHLDRGNLRELFSFEETLTDRDAEANDVVPILTRSEPRDPLELPLVPPTTPAELQPEAWAEGITPDGRIELNDLQKMLVAMAQRVDAEEPPPPAPEGLAPEPLPEPPFRSEAEFIEAFRRRHLDRT
jgi:hypothetical protein